MQPRARIELGHQPYAVLEQCREPEVLWAELATGHHGWPGVRRNGKYVLGRPQLWAVVPEDPAPPPDPARDLHRVECLGPLQRIGRWEAFATPAQARDAHLRTVREDPGAPPLTPGAWRVRLVRDERPAAEQYVVRSLPRLT